MMKIYKNTKTGTIIHSPCELQGLNWVEAKEKPEEAKEKPEEAKEKPKKTIKDVK